MPTHFLWFLFDWRGRISRSSYRTAILILALFVASLKMAPDKLHMLLVGVVSAQLVVQASLDAKRLHDIGFSAVWVPITSLACVGAAAALAIQAPMALAMVSRQVNDILGPAAREGGWLAIVVTGLSVAAILRSSLLWHPNSNKGGDVYAFTPGAGRAAVDGDDKSGASAEALIAKALAEQKAKMLKAAAEPAAERPVRSVSGAKPSGAIPAGGPRKKFGMRRSA